MSTVCTVYSEWSSRSNNIVRAPIAAAAVFHFSSVLKFLRGTIVMPEGNDGQLIEIRLARKDPVTDVDNGNDGGCCIIGNLDPVTRNGQFMPVYLDDIGTIFVEVLVAGERRGMALLFAGANERSE